MNDLERIELHDGVLKNINVDFVLQEISITCNIYLSNEATEKTPIEIKFEGVESISKIVNLLNLKNNSSAGNINYWVLSSSSKGTTYIYLSDGCIAISANKISINILSE